MGVQQNDTGTRAFQTGAAIGCFLRVKIDPTVPATPDPSFDVRYGRIVLADDEPDIGTTDRETFAEYECTNVDLRSKPGTHNVVANGAIAAGADVFTAADGKVGPAGAHLRGVAIEAAAADGDIIEIMPVNNH